MSLFATTRFNANLVVFANTNVICFGCLKCKACVKIAKYFVTYIAVSKAGFLTVRALLRTLRTRFFLKYGSIDGVKEANVSLNKPRKPNMKLVN